MDDFFEDKDDNEVRQPDNVVSEGLYCHRTQRDMIDIHTAVIDGEPFNPENSNKPTHKWDLWPTTRQGDDCEKRLDNIEEIMVTRGWKLANDNQESDEE